MDEEKSDPKRVRLASIRFTMKAMFSSHKDFELREAIKALREELLERQQKRASLKYLKGRKT